MSSEEKQHPQSIESFQWNDKAIYQWNLFLKETDWVGTLSGWLGGAILFPFLICFGFSLLGRWSLSGAYWAGVVGTGVMLSATAMHFYLSLKGQPHERREARSIVYYTSIASLGGLLFVLSAPQSYFAQGFRGVENAGIWVWALFFLDNFLNVIFVGIPELVLGLRFSAITYDNLFSRLLVFLIRLLITLGIIELLLALYRSRHQKTQLFATVKECYWHCDALPDSDQMSLRCEGKVTPFPDVIDIPITEFVGGLKNASQGEGV